MRSSSQFGDVQPSPVRLTLAARHAHRTAALALFFLCAALSWVCPAHAAAPPPDGTETAIRPDSSFTFADFDGDRQPDLATAEVEQANSHLTRYLIRLRLNSSRGAGQSIGVTGSFGLPQISALDVNGDNVPDLVVTAFGQHQPIAVLLNDGRGRFSVASPGDFISFLIASPWRWRAASGHLQDIAVLVLARTPRAEAARHGALLAPLPVSAGSAAAHHRFAPDALCSFLKGRSPPLLS